METKNSLRRLAKNIRKNLDINLVSNLIVERIRLLHSYKTAKNVMLFYPLQNEINLMELLKDDKNFYFPRVCGSELEVCPYKSGDELILSDLNILEPVSSKVDKSIIDIVFVPALCADNKCNRLGYGKGFYDRFLKDYNGCSVIPVSDDLIFNNICTDCNDVCCNMVITETFTICV